MLVKNRQAISISIRSAFETYGFKTLSYSVRLSVWRHINAIVSE